jgi:UDP-2,3-diacylglucosamine hydrolase
VSKRSNIYFASDLHLGAVNFEKSKERELLFVSWLDQIKEDAQELYIIGDVFDFWFEYKHVVPKGFLHLFGKLIELQNLGVKITLMRGNHDLWMFDYIEKELGIPVLDQVIEREFHGKKLLIGHGDGLGPGDKQYKILKKIFTNKVCRKLFSWMHPDLGVGFANRWSKYSRNSHDEEEEQFLGEDKEWLILYCKDVLKEKHYDYMLFGHRHLPQVYELNSQSKYVNTGDWLSYFSYVKLSEEGLELKYFKEEI